MQHAVESRAAPVHLWIVGILSVLWNGFGAYDYLMSRMRNTDYLTSMMPTVDANVFLAWVDAFPIWAQVGWGLGVWLGLVGALFLLLRSKFAVPSFALSVIGSILGLGYQMANPLPGMEGPMATVMPVVIIAVAIGQFLYARAQKASGALR